MWCSGSPLITTKPSTASAVWTGTAVLSSTRECNITPFALDSQKKMGKLNRGMVIANFMLYHVPDLNKSINEVRKV